MITKYGRIASRLLCLLILLAITGTAFAFNFTPIDATLRPAGSGATQTFSVENPSPSPVAVEITMHTREMTPEGDDVLESADHLFTVYPSQLILQPGARQSVRVQWTGEADIEREQAFRLIAEELPIRLGEEDDEGAGLDLLVRYVASVYVQPNGTAARLSIEAESTAEGVTLVIRNDGTMRAVLRDEDYRLLADGQVVEFDELQRDALAAVNVLAGKLRRIPVPGTADLINREIEVQWLRSSD